MTACPGCGTTAHANCPLSPSTRCTDCNGVNDWAARTYCACWTDIADLAPADVKALFADDCDGHALSVDLTRKEAS